ncbi:MAG: hypothetical protein HYV28_14455 [Ignavibacteriales bacterium]|nr:hypothetical protein [Ignavibacteriales bacterium]
MTKIGLILSLFCTILLTAQARPADSVNTGALTYNSFGFNASTVSGLGLSYRHHPEFYSLIQVSGGIIKTTDTFVWDPGSIIPVVRADLSEVLELDLIHRFLGTQLKKT